ncbi:hypothetical protein PSI23_06895 [Xenorhabdus sp. XENO-10]|uniref:Uncharacterized protein n=1 Tax=Xenorhabdus yunnanensis TaxID=3025878 RepID=A0ABT5LDA0_9GAMM|nr:hypothetical protein [Xenorhabdus yunnanensis]MDC9589054.1 hypothetical protein [Xenorhabdus yunnanensis]
MKNKELSLPSQEEMQKAFEKSYELYKKEKSHYEIVSKEKPELAHLFVKHPKMISLCGYGNGFSEYISSYFNINTYHQYGNYPFIQISSNSTTIGYQPNYGQQAIFNGYIQGGYDMPEVHFENLFLAGVLQNIQSVINAPLNFQLFINPENVILRFFEGYIYLGDLSSIYQHNFQAPMPIVFSGAGSFNYV